MMHKATPGVHRSLRNIAEEKNEAGNFDGPSEANYDARAGAPRGAEAGEYHDVAEVPQVDRPTGGSRKPFKIGG